MRRRPGMTTEAPDPQGEMPRIGFPYGLTIVTLIALGILIGLGNWQLDRRAWKQALLAEIAALQNAPSRPINAVLLPESRIDFARVTVAWPGHSAVFEPLCRCGRSGRGALDLSL